MKIERSGTWYPNLSKIFFFVVFCLGSNFSFSQSDNCSGTAPLLTVGNSCTTTSYTVSSSFNNDGSAPCNGTSHRDGWYRFTTDAATNVITINGTSNRSLGIAIYSGTCGSLTQIACTVPGTAGASLNNIQVDPNTTYYLRLMRTNNANINEMTGTICVFRGEFRVPQTGNNSYTMCSGTLYDNGGSAGNYANNSDGYTVINPSIPGNMAQVSGSITTEGGYDYLTIYDGAGTGGAVLWGGSAHGTGASSQTFTIPTITSMSGPLTVRFYSDGSNRFSGFALNVSCTSCIAPTGLTVDSVTGNSADLRWISSDTVFDVEWGIQDFLLGTGNLISSVSNPYPLGGLTPNTNYEYYVRTNCGGGNYSGWAGPYNFRTTCGSTIDEFPYTETFELDSDLLDCWVIYGYTAFSTWGLSEGNTNGSIPNAHNGELNALFDTGMNRGYPSNLASPRMDLSSLTSPSVSFWYSNVNWFGDVDELRVYYKSSYGDAWTLIPSAVYTTEHASWTYVELSLPNPSDDYYVAFEGNGNWARGVTLDDVTFYDAAADCKYVNTYQSDGTWSYANPTPMTNDNKKVIVKGNIVLNSEDEYCSLEVRPTGNLQINSNLTVNHKIVNLATADDFIVESDANLLQINNDAVNEGQIKVNRLITSIHNIPSQMDYIYWSSPVTGQQLKSFSPGTPNNRFFEYDEETDYFTSVNPMSNFVAGKGYAIRAEAGLTNGEDNTYSFTGIPNNGNLNHNIEIVKEGQGYNLVGNPYPSNIDADLLFEANPSIHTSVFFWSNNNYHAPNQQGSSYNGSNYSVYNKTGGNPATYPVTIGEVITNNVIKAGQGFIVQKIANGNSTLVFDNAMRISDAGTFYEKASKDRFWLTLTTPSELVNTTLIGFIPGAVDEYDPNYDAEHLGGSDAIFTTLGTKQLVIQGLEYPLEKRDVISLGVRHYQSGTHMITLQNVEGIFAGGQKIYLKDKYRNVIHPLSDLPYRYRTEAGEFTDRFEIIFKNSVNTASDEAFAKSNQVRIQKSNQQILISSEKEKIVSVEIFNLAGWSVYKNENVQANELHIPAAQFGKEIIVVKVLTETGEIVTKKIINK